ncbi:hypothetical protein NZK35_19540 [Stieleria sp. ICT_E10.1]|uniref:type IV pilus modification PilV family protein n=1 Tax=Stieleria sedimenti TaxID=2976331 RepID=UPI00217FB106|nr:hypothetical protein [Stieleria sedimenti]MCS7468851.1 hypothetical protein [Stieleria sedimenti]
MLHRLHPRKRNRRNGLVLLETLIAAGVTLVMLSVAVPMVIRSARIWKQTRHQQVAADELSGQLDRLIAMPAESRRQAMEQLTVSPAIAEVLHDATIDATLVNDDDGKRIEMSLQWTRAGDPLPVTLVAWIDPLPTTSSESPSPDETNSDETNSDDAEPTDAEPTDAESAAGDQEADQ